MKFFFTLFVILLILQITYSENNVAEIINKTDSSPLELIKDWRIIAVAVSLITGILVAIAYMAGISFEMPDLKAWASVESNQIITNALIIILLVGTITFLDGIVATMVNSSSTGITCTSSNSITCVQKVAQEYSKDLLDLATENAGGLVLKSYELGGKAAERQGFSCNTFLLPPCLWVSYSYSINPHLMIDIERFTYIIENYGSIVASLQAQLFFVNNISFALGPIILAMGIVGRAFFVTRKLGGLLIAIAVGVMFVFPLMYAFNWLTLNVYVFGDKFFGNQVTGTCPSVCKQSVPTVYSIGDGTKLSYSEASQKFSSETMKTIDLYLQTGAQTVATEFGDYGLCSPPSDGQIESVLNGSNQDISGLSNAYYLCPNECRKLPYPISLATCKPPTIQKACATVEEKCKVKTIISKSDPSVDPQQKNLCPNNCKTIVPLKNNCDITKNMDHYLDTFGPGERQFEGLPSDGSIDKKWECDASSYQTTEIAAACASALGVSKENIVSSSLNPSFELDGSMVACTLECDYVRSCFDAPLTCRMTQYEVDKDSGKIIESSLSKNLASACTTTKKNNAKICPVSTNPEESCVYAIPKDVKGCEKCILTEPTYTTTADSNYDSFAVVDCANLCGGDSPKGLSISTGEFAKISGEGMVGRTEIKNLSQLLLPAFILPLINILVTVMFVKTFSQFLGGDIEIPGLPKVL